MPEAVDRRAPGDSGSIPGCVAADIDSRQAELALPSTIAFPVD